MPVELEYITTNAPNNLMPSACRMVWTQCQNLFLSHARQLMTQLPRPKFCRPIGITFLVPELP